MAKKNGKAHTNGASGLDLTNAEILDAAEGFARLLKVRFPATLSFALQRRYQAVKFAAVPVNKARTASVNRFTKKDRRGQPVPGAEPGTVVLTDGAAFTAESTALFKVRQRVHIEPLTRSEIPEKVDGKPVVIEGEVWELLGPLLVD